MYHYQNEQLPKVGLKQLSEENYFVVALVGMRSKVSLHGLISADHIRATEVVHS